MQKGWIKLQRRIQSHWLYQEKRVFSRYEAWLDLLMMANHKQNKVVIGNELVTVEKGSFITSELKLMQRWKWGKSKTRNFLKLLEDDNMIVKKSDRQKTTISICNYSVYQEEGQENRPLSDHEQTNDRPRANTNKNAKNVKNVKNKERRKRVYDETSVYFQLATFFFEQIKNNNPEHKEPNLQNWSDDIRKMMELDKRTEEQVRYLIQWVQQDDFEMVNVLSPAKLRKRWDQLVMKVKQENKSLNNVTPIDKAQKKYNYGF